MQKNRKVENFCLIKPIFRNYCCISLYEFFKLLPRKPQRNRPALSGPSPPPSARGDVCAQQCKGGHQVCPSSTVSSLRKSGPLRAASSGSLLCGNFYNLARLFLGAPCSSQICLTQKGERLQQKDWTSLAGELHNKPPWLAVLSLWPRSNSPCPLLTGWSSLLDFSTKNPYLHHLQQHHHTLPWKCVKWRRLITSNNLLQQLNVIKKSPPPEQGFPLFFLPSGSRFLCVRIPSQLLTLALTFVKRTSQILHNKSQDTHL